MSFQIARRNFLVQSSALAIAMGAKVSAAATEARAKIHSHLAPVEGFLVNSFVIETPKSLIIVDAQMLTTEAEKVKQLAAKLNKPIKGIIITHPHLDHFAGLATLRQGLNDVPVYATRNTQQKIAQIEAKRAAESNDKPNDALLPSKVMESGATLNVDGVSILFDELDNNESENLTALYLPNQRELIASDLIYEGCHAWLAEGHSNGWIEDLQYLKRQYGTAARVYAGHGVDGLITVIDKQLDYLRLFQEQVRKQLNGKGTVSDSAVDAITQVMQAEYPKHGLDFLLKSNVEAVAKELAIS